MTKRKRRPLGETMGGMIVGFDYQVFRTTRPPAELVQAAKPIPPVASSDGGELSIELPDVGAAPTADPARAGDPAIRKLPPPG